MFSIGVGDERANLSLFNELSIVYSLSSRNSQNSHPHFQNQKVKERKLKFAKILSNTPRENYSASEVACVAKDSRLDPAYLMTFLAFFFLPSKFAQIRFKTQFLFSLEEIKLMKA